jgi:sugar/nucleoside kinase (ribokinase family)
MGAVVGIATACTSDVDLQPLKSTDLMTFPSDQTTTFRNIEGKQGRRQKIIAHGRSLSVDLLPADWCNADVVHLAPVADEIELELLDRIRPDSLFMTPQGWLRGWDENGDVFKKSWQNIDDALAKARATVCSFEDLDNDRSAALEMAQKTPLLVVTRSEQGAMLFLDGEKHEIDGIDVEAVDSTGSGDIFAAVFFFELTSGSSPHQAALRANYLAACSVSRYWLDSIPTQTEIEHARGSF